MQTSNQNEVKSKFKAGLLSALAFMSKLVTMNKQTKLAERFKLGVHSPKRRHRYTFGGPLSHSMNVKKFVGGRSAARRARRFIKATPAWFIRYAKDTANPVIDTFKDKLGKEYSRLASGQIVNSAIQIRREEGFSRAEARQIMRELA